MATKKRNDWNSLLKFSMEENRIKMHNVIEANNWENLRTKSKLKNMQRICRKKYSINKNTFGTHTTKSKKILRQR